MFPESMVTMDVRVVTRESLSESTTGPLFLDEYDATIVVPPRWTARLDESGNLVMEIGVAS